MSFSIAVLADPHLPDDSGTVNDIVFDWALQEVRQAGVELVVLAGDLTAAGTLAAARRGRDKLERTGIPWRFAPGNSDRRNASERKAVLQCLLTPEETVYPGVPAILTFDNNKRLPDLTRRRILESAQRGDRQLFLAAHLPLDAMEADDRTFLRGQIEAGVIGVFAAGHAHDDRCKGAEHVIRAMDPSKALNGPPAFSIFSHERGRWIRRDREYRDGDIVNWSPGERAEFESWLGVSGMEHNAEYLQRATELRLPVFELRESVCPSADLELAGAVRRWRAAGGRILSLHLPDLGWREGSVTGAENLDQAVAFALRHGVDAVTVHVPRCAVGAFAVGSPCRAEILRTATAALAPLTARKIVIGIENLHMRPGEKPDDHRGFGYTPEECLGWIGQLREALHSESVGMLLDVGHARNNAPYDQLFTIGQWLAAAAPLIVGLHVHQVTLDESGAMHNHRPFEGRFCPLIALGSLYTAWKHKRLRHVPLYLEIRGAPPFGSLHRIRGGSGRGG